LKPTGIADAVWNTEGRRLFGHIVSLFLSAVRQKSDIGSEEMIAISWKAGEVFISTMCKMSRIRIWNRQIQESGE
jgi:hypothetical protein